MFLLLSLIMGSCDGDVSTRKAKARVDEFEEISLLKEQEIARLKEKKAELGKKYATLQADHITKALENSQLIAKLSKETDELKGRLNQVMSENVELRTKLKNYYKNKEEDAIKEREERLKLTNKLLFTESQLDVSKSELQKVTRQRNRLQHMKHHIKTEYNRSEAAISILLDEKMELEAKNKELKDRLDRSGIVFEENPEEDS